MNIQTLAKKYITYFTTGKRRTTDESFVYIKDDCESLALTELVHKAHGEFLPDDTRYKFILDSLHLVAESDSEEAAQEAIDTLEGEITWKTENGLKTKLSKALKATTKEVF